MATGFLGLVTHRALPRPQNVEGIRFKFNPWHDPDNGRFTFAGTGSYFGRGGNDPSGGAARPSNTNELVRDRGGYGGGGAHGSWTPRAPTASPRPARRETGESVR